MSNIYITRFFTPFIVALYLVFAHVAVLAGIR